MRGRFAALLVIVGSAGVVGGTDLASVVRDHWDHEAHRGLFPSCLSCHAGIVDTSRSRYPSPESCERCHNGEIQERVEWFPPVQSHSTNLNFDHEVHFERTGATGDRRSSLCTQCHSESGAEWLAIQYSVVERCLECHEIEVAHLAAPDTACATCHVTLAEADRLTEEDVAEFPVPPSHDEPEFAVEGHGRMAVAMEPVAASCATCHASEFCTQCHVDAPENGAIQALGTNPRTLVHLASVPQPRTHERADFLRAHGELATAADATCSTCHTRESCTACHRGDLSEVVTNLRERGEGRATGAIVERAKPPSHTALFVDRHGPLALEREETCAGCHVREDCLDCHRVPLGSASNGDVMVTMLGGGPGLPGSEAALAPHAAARVDDDREPPATHAGDYVRSHGPDAAAAPETCAGCHVREDCLDCHQPGPGAGSPGYHPADFLSRHPAASYGREVSCADCHNVRYFCTDCHQRAGLTATGPINAGYHDAKNQFILGHGEAARQSLESCVSCHAERDCLLCHSAQGGRRFNPHGPGFDADRWRRSNPEMCSTCHGFNIPGAN